MILHHGMIFKRNFNKEKNIYMILLKPIILKFYYELRLLEQYNKISNTRQNSQIY